MNQETWTAVDRYLTDLFEPADSVLEAALAASAAAGLPAINITPAQGKLLQLLARMQRAENFLRLERSAGTAPSGWRAPCRRWTVDRAGV